MAEPARLERRKRGDEPSERESRDEGEVGECVGEVTDGQRFNKSKGEKFTF